MNIMNKAQRAIKVPLSQAAAAMGMLIPVTRAM